MTSVSGLETWVPAALGTADEFFWECPNLDTTTLQIGGWSTPNLSPRDGSFLGFFNFIPNNKALDPAVYAQFLQTQNALNLPPNEEYWYGFGVTPVQAGAATAARTDMIANKNRFFTDGATSSPDQMAAPSMSVSGTTITADLAEGTFNNGLPILSEDIRYSTDETNWTALSDVSEPVDFSGVQGAEYFAQSRANNFRGNGAWSASAQITVPAVAGPTVLAIEDVIFTPALGADPASVDIPHVYESGSGTVTAYLVTGTDPVSISDADLKSETGNPIVSEFFNNVLGSGLTQFDLAITDTSVDRLRVLLSDGTIDSDPFEIPISFPDQTASVVQPGAGTPADDATDVAVDSNITIVFDEPVVEGTGNFYIYDTSGPTLVETIAVGAATISTNNVILNPVADLDAGGDFAVRWDAGVVVDGNGNAVLGNVTDTLLNFATVTAPSWTPNSDPSAISWGDPSDGATIAATGSSVDSKANKVAGGPAFTPVGAAPQTGGLINGRAALICSDGGLTTANNAFDISGATAICWPVLWPTSVALPALATSSLACAAMRSQHSVKGCMCLTELHYTTSQRGTHWS